MKTMHFLLVAILLTAFITSGVIAQKEIPVTTKSEETKTLYKEIA